MGTPEFAVASLDILLKKGYNIVGVVTATDKYGGRGGKKLIQSDVKKYALEHGLNILQPKNLKSPAFIKELRALKADLQIIVAFRMLPEIVWSMPLHGSYNLHGSLLPKYRGAAPIHWAVINGETETGVTSFKLQHKIDTGDILFQESTPIDPNETTGDVYNRLKDMGAQVVLKTVQAIESGDIILQDQDESQVCKAPKIFKETCEIDFDKSAKQVHDFIRGMNPFPGAWAVLQDKEYKIWKSEILKEKIEGNEFIKTDNKTYLYLKCKDQYLSIKELQMQGKKRMDIKTFLNGYKL